MPRAGRYLDVKWFIRYAIGCLIAMFVIAGMYGYNRPGKDLPVGAVVALAVVWPITAAIVAGVTIGEVASDDWDAEKTVSRLK
jgi:hypothetical protein